MLDIDDSYPSCARTYTTLCVTSKKYTLGELEASMTCAPTRIVRLGEERNKRRDVYEHNGWFYSTKGLIESRDCRRHIDHIIREVVEASNFLRSLDRQNLNLWLSVFYDYYQGGPTLSPGQMGVLASAGIEMEFDLYHECNRNNV